MNLMPHLVTFIYIISLFSGVACISVFGIYRNNISKAFGLDMKTLGKFLIVFFCFFTVNFFIYYNEFFMFYPTFKKLLLVIFDILLVSSVYYVIKLNSAENSRLMLKVFLSVGFLYIIMWFSTYVFDFSEYLPLRPIIELTSDAIFSATTTGIMIICSIYQKTHNSDVWESRYLIIINIMMAAYACMLYCADLLTELSIAYISSEYKYPYLYDPIVIVFILVNVFTGVYITISNSRIKAVDIAKATTAGSIAKENAADDVSKEYGISTREQEVIDLIVRGCNNSQIAEELSISVYTVKRHVNNIFKKLEVKNRFELLCRLQEKRDSGESEKNLIAKKPWKM